MAERTQNQAINAIKYFYENVVKRDKMFIDDVFEDENWEQ